MLDYFKNQYLRDMMVLMGVPDSFFNHADPLHVFFVFIFSSEIFVILLSIVIWGTILFFRSFIHGDPKSAAGATRIEDLGFQTHEYTDKKKVKTRFKEDKPTGFFAVVVKGFMLPVIIIFFCITVTVRFTL